MIGIKAGVMPGRGKYQCRDRLYMSAISQGIIKAVSTYAVGPGGSPGNL